VQINGLWGEVKSDYQSFNYIDFSNIDFSNFTFSTDTTPQKTVEKVKFKKIDKIAFRVSNSNINQPFGIDSFGFIYTEKGINKGDN
jgi:hypothetical protein